MRVIIEQNYDKMSRWAANHIVETIKAFKPTAKKPFILGLPTGSTPIGTYKELVRLYKKGQISFKNVVTFNMDEYVRIPEDHPESVRSPHAADDSPALPRRIRRMQHKRRVPPARTAFHRRPAFVLFLLRCGSGHSSGLTQREMRTDFPAEPAEWHSRHAATCHSSFPLRLPRFLKC